MFIKVFTNILMFFLPLKYIHYRIPFSVDETIQKISKINHLKKKFRFKHFFIRYKGIYDGKIIDHKFNLSSQIYHRGGYTSSFFIIKGDIREIKDGSIIIIELGLSPFAGIFYSIALLVTLLAGFFYVCLIIYTFMLLSFKHEYYSLKDDLEELFDVKMNN